MGAWLRVVPYLPNEGQWVVGGTWRAGRRGSGLGPREAAPGGELGRPGVGRRGLRRREINVGMDRDGRVCVGGLGQKGRDRGSGGACDGLGARPGKQPGWLVLGHST